MAAAFPAPSVIASAASADMDVEIVGTSGVHSIRDMPHARFDCLVKPWPKTGTPTVEQCAEACDKCFCWVCDKPWADCKDWATGATHCMACDTPEWVTKRRAHQMASTRKQA